MVNKVYFAAVIVCATLAFLLCTVKLETKYENYRKAKWWFATDMFLLAISCGMELLFTNDTSTDLINFPLLAVAIPQAVLFTFLALTLIESSKVQFFNALKLLLPIIVGGGGYLVALFWVDDKKVYGYAEFIEHFWHPMLLLRTFLFLYYLGLLIYLVTLFRTEHRKFRSRLNDFSSESDALHFRLSGLVFYLATLMGVVAFVYALFPSELFDACMGGLIIVLYIIATIAFLNHNQHVALIVEVAKVSEAETKADLNELPTNDGELFKRLEELTEQGLFYCRPQITSSDVADLLGTRPRTLAQLIKLQYDRNFNQWINGMRIERAKILMLADEQKALVEIAEAVGFLDLPHFSREFKRITGVSPSKYKMK